MATDPILTPACELAFEVARDGVEGWPVQEPPPAMRSFLYVAQLPRRALTVAQRAIEEDTEFRGRVAERATEANVGRAGWLWLHRPEGWEAELSELTGGAYGVESDRLQPAVDQEAWTSADSEERRDEPMEAETPPTESLVRRVLSSDIERELDGLRGLVDRLADERRAVTSSVQQLESEVEQRRSESSQLSAHLDSLRQELDSVRTERDALEGAVVTVQQQLADERAASAELRRELDTVLVDNERLRAERDRLAENQRATSEAQQALLGELSGHLEHLQGEREAILAELHRSNTQLVMARERITQATSEATEQLDREVLPSLGSAGDAARHLQGAVDEAVDRLERLRATLDRAGTPEDALTEPEPEAQPAPAEESAEIGSSIVGEQPEEPMGAWGQPETEPAPTWDQPETEPAPTWDQLLSDDVAGDTGDERAPEHRSEWDALLEEAPAGEASPVPESLDAEHQHEETGTATADDGVEVREPWGDRADDEHVRRAIEVPDGLRDDELETAKFVVRAADVVLLVDGDRVASTGWPTLEVGERRDALVAYLADLEADTGAAPDVVFDHSIGDEQSLPEAETVRVRLTAPGVTASLALGQLLDTYPIEWPLVVISDDRSLLELAEQHGVTILSPVQLLDLFIAQ